MEVKWWLKVHNVSLSVQANQIAAKIYQSRFIFVLPEIGLNPRLVALRNPNLSCFAVEPFLHEA
jgi:hypothetical protein